MSFAFVSHARSLLRLGTTYRSLTSDSRRAVMASVMAVAFAGVTLSPAAAQTSTSEEPQTPSAETDLSLGEDASAPSNLGQAYIKDKVGDWDLRCLRTQTPENDPCQIYQLLSDNSGAPVAEFSLFRLPPGGQAVAGATVIVPLETALQQQLTISVDNAPGRRYPFAFCNEVGCYARIGLTEEDVTSFKRGNAAVLSIIPFLAPDQRVELTLSLTGFTAGYDQVTISAQ